MKLVLIWDSDILHPSSSSMLCDLKQVFASLASVYLLNKGYASQSLKICSNLAHDFMIFFWSVCNRHQSEDVFVFFPIPIDLDNHQN